MRAINIKSAASIIIGIFMNHPIKSISLMEKLFCLVIFSLRSLLKRCHPEFLKARRFMLFQLLGFNHQPKVHSWIISLTVALKHLLVDAPKVFTLLFAKLPIRLSLSLIQRDWCQSVLEIECLIFKSQHSHFWYQI